MEWNIKQRNVHTAETHCFQIKIVQHNYVLGWKLLVSVKKQEKLILTLSNEYPTLGEAKTAAEEYVNGPLGESAYSRVLAYPGV